MAQDKEQQKIDELVERAVRDPEFRERLVANPKDALKDLQLADDEIDRIVGGIRRSNFFSGKLITAADLTAEQKYKRNWP